RSGEHLVEIRGDDAAVRGAGRPHVLSGDHDRRNHALGRSEAAHAKSGRVRGPAAEALVKRVALANRQRLLLETGEVITEDVGDAEHARYVSCMNAFRSGVAIVRSR